MNVNNPKSSDQSSSAEAKKKESDDYLELPEGDEPTEKLHGGKRGRKRIFQRIADTFKSGKNKDSDETPSKKKKVVKEGEVEGPSGSARLTDVEGESLLAKKSKKNSQKSQQSRGNEEEESPKPLKG